MTWIGNGFLTREAWKVLFPQRGKMINWTTLKLRPFLHQNIPVRVKRGRDCVCVCICQYLPWMFQEHLEINKKKANNHLMEQVLHKRFSTWPISTGRDAQLLYQRIASYRQTIQAGEAARAAGTLRSLPESKFWMFALESSLPYLLKLNLDLPLGLGVPLK